MKDTTNVIKDTCYRGTRILVGNQKRSLIDNLISVVRRYNSDFQEIQIPIIQYQEIFHDKVGKENANLMFNFIERGNRHVCLAPEYTAVVQKLADGHFKHQTDVPLFYVAECFRGEKPQAGRYRQFTQFGVEVLNPKVFTMDRFLLPLAIECIQCVSHLYSVYPSVKRGLDYYKNGDGFEITLSSLGSSKQVCGGGEYEGGMGFTFGIDRMLDYMNKE